MVCIADDNGAWGIMDGTGKLIVPCIYDNIRSSFSEGLAPVQKDGKWGFIDTSGNLVIPCEYDLDEFSSNVAYANGCIFYIKDHYLTIFDKDGNRIY